MFTGTGRNIPAVIGAQAFRALLSRREHLRRANKVGILLVLMLVTYPAIQVLYGLIRRTIYEISILVLLIIFKIATNLRAASHVEDIILEQVIFTVDFFHALYLATFMPGLVTSSVIGILIFDLVDTSIELRELYHRIQSALLKLRGLSMSIDVDDNNNDLLSAVRSLCYSSEMIQTQQIRVHSCVYHQLSNEGRPLLQKFESHSIQLRDTTDSWPRHSTIALPDSGFGPKRTKAQPID